MTPRPAPRIHAGNGMLRTEFYAMLLKAASEEIRRLDPGACIIAFNTAGGTPDRGQALKADGVFQELKYIDWRVSQPSR